MSAHPFVTSATATAKRDIRRCIDALERAMFAGHATEAGSEVHDKAIGAALRWAESARDALDVADHLAELAEREQVDGV